MNVNEAIKGLAEYGLEKELFSEEDTVYVINSIIAALKLDSYEACKDVEKHGLEELLNIVLDDAAARGVIVFHMQ